MDRRQSILVGCAGGNVRRKRRTKYTWLPTLNGVIFNNDENHGSANWQTFILDVPTSGDVITAVVPVVGDTPQGSITTVATEGLGEIVGNEYLLRRIVGKVFCSYNFTNNTEGTINPAILPPIVVTAGWFVARADPGNLNQPIGYGSNESQGLYSSSISELTRQPWIWRRTWVLGLEGYGPGTLDDQGLALGIGNTLNGDLTYPQNNTKYGSVQDGPHVDAKTGRRVRLEERLWFTASASTRSANEIPGLPSVIVMVDARYLGALRRPKARSNFA